MRLVGAENRLSVSTASEPGRDLLIDSRIDGHRGAKPLTIFNAPDGQFSTAARISFSEAAEVSMTKLPSLIMNTFGKPRTQLPL